MASFVAQSTMFVSLFDPARDGLSMAPGLDGASLVREGTAPRQGRNPKLLEQVRAAIRLRRYSRRTEEAYVGWIRRFVLTNGKRHPAEMSEPEVTRFLSNLATEGRVSASTQNQALAALLFLYKDILKTDLAWLDNLVRAKRPPRLPVVLSRTHVLNRGPAAVRSPVDQWTAPNPAPTLRSSLPSGLHRPPRRPNNRVGPPPEPDKP